MKHLSIKLPYFQELQPLPEIRLAPHRISKVSNIEKPSEQVE
jgi:hypothetical protein